MAKQCGPKLTIEASCFNCEHERSEHYTAQSDSGCKVSCAHPDSKGRIGDTTWKTPTWCPLLPAALAALQAEMSKPAAG